MVYRLFSYSEWFGLHRPKRKSRNQGVYILFSATVWGLSWELIKILHTKRSLKEAYLDFAEKKEAWKKEIKIFEKKKEIKIFASQK